MMNLPYSIELVNTYRPLRPRIKAFLIDRVDRWPWWLIRIAVVVLGLGRD